MTPRIFELPIPGVIAVELPYNALSPEYINAGHGPRIVCNSTSTANGLILIHLPPGNWKLIDRLSEVTEEQAAGLVAKFGISTWLNYITKLDCHTAIASLYSAIWAAGLFTENPYGKEQRSYSELMDGVDRDELAEDMRKRHEAQQRTICPERTVILKSI